MNQGITIKMLKVTTKWLTEFLDKDILSLFPVSYNFIHSLFQFHEKYGN